MAALGERQLGALELVYDWIHPTTDQIDVQTFLLSSRRAISDEHLQRTVLLWIQRHPLLRVCIETRPEGKFYVPIHVAMSPALLRCLPAVSGWVDLAESELTRPLDTARGPLWRAHFGPAEPARSADGCWRYVLVLTLHHCIMDARNLFALVCELLDLLSGRRAPLAAFSELPPCLEQLIFDGQFAYWGAPPVLDEQWLVPGRKLPSSFGAPAPHKGVCRMLPFAFSTHVTERLLRRSQEHGVKMNATLCTVASIAMAQLMEERGETTPCSVQFHLPVNLRPYLHTDLDQMGCYLSVFTCRSELAPSLAESKARFWPVAKKQNDALHARLQRGEAVEAAKMDSFLLRELQSGKTLSNDVSFCFSNIGQCDYAQGVADEDSIGLEAAYRVAACVEDSWTAAIFHAVTTVNGRLFWNLGFNDKPVRTDVATRYKDIIHEIVAAIAAEQ